MTFQSVDHEIIEPRNGCSRQSCSACKNNNFSRVISVFKIFRAFQTYHVQVTTPAGLRTQRQETRSKSRCEFAAAPQTCCQNIVMLSVMLPEKLACIRNSLLSGSSMVAKNTVQRRLCNMQYLCIYTIICPDLWGEKGQRKSSQIDDVMFYKVVKKKIVVSWKKCNSSTGTLGWVGSFYRSQQHDHCMCEENSGCVPKQVWLSDISINKFMQK